MCERQIPFNQPHAPSPSDYFLTGAAGQDITFTLHHLFQTAKTDYSREKAGRFGASSEIWAATVSNIKMSPACEDDFNDCLAAAKLKDSEQSYDPGHLVFMSQ